MHIKGFLLQRLAECGPQWDYELAAAVDEQYHLGGAYWYGTVRLTLIDLFAGGLLDEVETTIDPSRSHGEEKLLFRFTLNDFGRERMRQSGLAVTR